MNRNWIDYWSQPVGVIGTVALAVLLIVGTNQVQAQEQAGAAIVRSVHVGELRPGALRGLTYAGTTQQFLALAGGSDADPAGSAPAKLVAFTPYQQELYSVELPAELAEASGLAFDAAANRLLLITGDLRTIVQMRVDEQGRVALPAEPLFDTAAWGVGSAAGMAVNQDGSALFVLDALNQQIVRIGLHPEDGQTEVQKLSLAALAANDLRGLAIAPATGHFLTLNADGQMLYELSPAGEQVAAHKVGDLALAAPHSLVFAPSADLTDAAEQTHLYLASNHVSAVQTEAGSMGWGHALAEAALIAPGALAQAASMAATPLPLVQTIAMSAFSPPSPDPSGVAYLVPADILLVSDGEVDEVAIFAGDNLFGTRRDGTLAYSGTTIDFSDEPTGVAYNPYNGHLFYAEDDARKIFEVDPGPDREHGTEDDIVTSFSTADFQSMDPEGLAFDPVDGVLYIADGTNREVYRVAPGPNGRFDGVAASGGDDGVTQFDVLALGIEDPEGIEYGPVEGHLMMTGSDETLLYEITTAGSLVAIYDISGAQAENPAGIAVAPGSASPDKASYYVVDRGIDNNEDPTENDGKMYEFGANVAMPTPVPTLTSTPMPSPTPTTAPTTQPTATPPGDTISEDSFESGDLSRWSSQVGSGDALTVSPAAALAGKHGLQVTVQNAAAAYLVDEQPAAEPRYRARFYFDPNSFQIAEGAFNNIFYAYSSNVRSIRLIFTFANGSYQIRPGLFDDADTWIAGDWIALSDAPHVLEIDWAAASAAGANDGHLKFWLDGVERVHLTGVDNDTHRIERIRLGATSGIDAEMGGSYYFDAFVSRRESYIGPDGDAPILTRLLLPFIRADK